MRQSFLALGVIAGLTGGAASAASITVEPPITKPLFAPYPSRTMEGVSLQGMSVDLAGYKHIRLEGEIVEGDASRLQAVLDTMEIDVFGDTILSLSSPGGSFAEALAIGDILSARGIGTYVADGSVCLSACAFAYLGGQRMVIRGVLWEPWRYLHENATLGFHSPSLPGGIPRGVLDAVGADVLFAEIAAPTLDNIRELQARAEGWMLTNELLFEVLGRVGAEEFFFVERLEETTSNFITVVGAPAPAQAALGMIEARAACTMVLREHFRDAGSSRIFAAPSVAELAMRGFFEQDVSGVVATPEELGQEAFQIEMFLPGSGNPVCTVWIDGDQYRVAYDQTILGDVYSPGTQTLSDGRVAFSVHPRNVIGYGLPWSAIGDDDLLVGDRDALYAEWPEPYHDLAASFDFCAPRDAATWQLICRFEALHEAVRMLTAVVETHRVDRPEAPEVYADWQQDVQRYCRPGVGSGALREMMLGYCGFAVTQTHLFRAGWSWRDGRVEPSPL